MLCWLLWYTVHSVYWRVRVQYYFIFTSYTIHERYNILYFRCNYLFFILSYYDVTVDKYSMKCTKKPVAVFTFCYRLPSENRELLSVNNEMIHPQWHQNRQQKISVFFWRNRNRQTIFSVCALQCQSFMCAVKLWSV